MLEDLLLTQRYRGRFAHIQDLKIVVEGAMQMSASCCRCWNVLGQQISLSIEPCRPCQISQILLYEIPQTDNYFGRLNLSGNEAIAVAALLHALKYIKDNRSFEGRMCIKAAVVLQAANSRMF